MKAERSGFKTFNESHIHLDLDQVFTLKAQMDVGVVSDSITVEANAAQVESTDMHLSQTVKRRRFPNKFCQPRADLRRPPAYDEWRRPSVRLAAKIYF